MGARLQSVTSGLQDRLASAFGIRPPDRTTAVAEMLAKSGKQGASYWLPLVLSMAIATFGLVLGSGAVVIGAMLISPLMAPIVELGMGLAIASPFLVLRSFVRVATSLAVVIASAAVITLFLPYHEVTSEIAARTSPTVLDLLVAVGCAIAAAYTVVRPGSDTTATAAGTSIGIALVPPLCVIGYGVGTRSASIAGGAALLFTANLCAILLFAVVCFIVLGYGQVVTSQLEAGEFQNRREGEVGVRIAKSLGALFTSKYGPGFRLLMPLVLVVSVYVPLRKALREVTWQVSVRTAIQDLLDKRHGGYVQTAITLERHEVDVRLVIVGGQEEAARLRDELLPRIEAVAGVKPSVQVVAVPDAEALRRVEATMKMPVVPPPPAHADLPLLRKDVDTALARAWPQDAAGPLLRWSMEFPPSSGVPLIETVHLGPSLGPAGEHLLAGPLSNGLGHAVTVRDIGLPVEPATAEVGEQGAWVGAATRTMDLLSGSPEVYVCVLAPGDSKARRDGGPAANVLRDLPAFQRDRVSVSAGARWELRLSMSPCSPPVDAGLADGAAD